MYKNELYHFGVKGMKWGVRRYQNEDGSLTNAGKKRQRRDEIENKGRKNKVHTNDPNRWVKEDMQRTKQVIDSSRDLSDTMSRINNRNIEKELRSRKQIQKQDLSNMSDQELRNQINRKLLEQQYNSLFAEQKSPEVSRGKVYMKNVLDTTGNLLAISGSAVGLALAIKELRG